MKRSISFFPVITISAFLFLMSCNSNDNYSEPSATVETPAVDTSHNLAVEQPGMMSSDTSGSASMKQQAAAKSKKGKVSSIMMTSSNKNSPMNLDKQGYYSNVEVLPAFPGGQSALDNFVFKNLEYPEEAVENNIEGIVTVNFAVDEAGRVSNPKVVGKPIGYGLEDAVLKAIKTMPTWTPGIIKGKNVKTYYTLPVNFKLE